MAKSKRKSPVRAGSFSEAFYSRLDKINERLKAGGSNMTVLCRRLKISRADPVRWRNAVPHTIALIDRMEREVDRIIEKAQEKADSESSKK